MVMAVKMAMEMAIDVFKRGREKGERKREVRSLRIKEGNGGRNIKKRY